MAVAGVITKLIACVEAEISLNAPSPKQEVHYLGAELHKTDERMDIGCCCSHQMPLTWLQSFASNINAASHLSRREIETTNLIAVFLDVYLLRCSRC